MKTNWLYSSGSSEKARKSLFQKMLVVSTIVVLVTAFLPVSSVFATPASDDIDEGTLGVDWKSKTSMVHAETLFYARIKLFPTDFKNSKDMARPYELLDKYGSALKQANDIITKHTGFDERGEVLDVELASQSVHDLGECLRIMHGTMTKMEEEGYPFRLVK